MSSLPSQPFLGPCSGLCTLPHIPLRHWDSKILDRHSGISPPLTLDSEVKHPGAPPQEQGHTQVPRPLRPRTALQPQRLPWSTAPTDLLQAPSGSAPPFFVVSPPLSPRENRGAVGSGRWDQPADRSSLRKTRSDGCRGNWQPLARSRPARGEGRGMRARRSVCLRPRPLREGPSGPRRLRDWDVFEFLPHYKPTHPGN